MTEVAFSVVPASPLKRAHDSLMVTEEALSIHPTLLSPAHEHTMDRQDVVSTHGTMTRQESPTPSTMSSLTELSTPGSARKPQPSGEPPAKKRKFNYIEKEAEKAAKQRDKDEKARLKAEEKARKEEEKARKDEENRKAAEEKESAKRAKEIEKTEKQKAKEAEKSEREAKKEAEKQKKEVEKAQKEAEKLKKERSQMRLGAFFGKPIPAATPPSTPDDVCEAVASRRSSIASIDVEKPAIETKLTTSHTNSDYHKWILPFFVPEHTELAPHNRYKHARPDVEDIPLSEDADVEPLEKRYGRPRKRLRKTVPVKELMGQMQELGNDDVVNLVARDVLGTYPYKVLQFVENVRPPYQGTYTRVLSPRTSRKLSRNPFSRSLPERNYDYDSEAEWEPPADDDEDLNDEDEMSDADDNEDEMADFLDDSDDAGRRKGPLADMMPISSGLCWAGSTFDDNGINMQQYRMDVLHDSVKLPIDPFATKHWADVEKPKPTVKVEASTTTMQPPRHPLAALTANALHNVKQERGIDGKPLLISSQKPGASSTNKPVKMIDPEYMKAFTAAIAGSDLTKAGLIEILKKQFPKCSKDAIKDTVGVVAVRVGKKESEKRWELIETA